MMDWMMLLKNYLEKVELFLASLENKCYIYTVMNS